MSRRNHTEDTQMSNSIGSRKSAAMYVDIWLEIPTTTVDTFDFVRRFYQKNIKANDVRFYYCTFLAVFHSCTFIPESMRLYEIDGFCIIIMYLYELFYCTLLS
jgi:hypothetical protein